MRLLLDTHVIFWRCIDQSKLRPTALAAISEAGNEVSVGITSAREMAIKVGLQKWPEAAELVATFEEEIRANDFSILPITILHVRAAGLMPSLHCDPFDRLLAAQAQIEGFTLVTADPKVQTLGAPWMW